MSLHHVLLAFTATVLRAALGTTTALAVQLPILRMACAALLGWLLVALTVCLQDPLRALSVRTMRHVQLQAATVCTARHRVLAFAR